MINEGGRRSVKLDYIPTGLKSGWIGGRKPESGDVHNFKLEHKFGLP